MLCSFSFSFFLLTFTGEAGEFFFEGYYGCNDTQSD